VLSRRSFLLGLGTVGVGVALGACGPDAGSVASTDASLLAFFDPNGGVFSGSEQRLAFGFGNKDGVPLEAAKSPAQLSFTFTGAGAPTGAIVANRVTTGLPRPIWVPRATFSKPGTFDVVARGGGATVKTTFTALDPSSDPVINTGATMLAFDTPTIDNHRGVEPFCTKPTPCPFHTVTLADALKLGRPTAFLISTPAHCKTVVCGPVLDFLINSQATYGSRVTMIHGEVYSDADATTIAPVVEALKLTTEPVLFLIDAKGKIVDRFEGVFAQEELTAGLVKLVQ
jgi:hypothetical protein